MLKIIQFYEVNLTNVKIHIGVLCNFLGSIILYIHFGNFIILKEGRLLKEAYPSYEEIQNLLHKLEKMRTEYWLHHDLFSFQWWLLLVIFIGPWIIWLRYVQRDRIKEILLFGTLLMILVGFLDDIGVHYNLWSYPYKLTSVVPRLVAIDYGIIIVAHMSVYQYFRSWKSFLTANVVMATVFSFVCEPITVWLGIYRLDNWEYAYSIPIYVLKAAFVKWIVDVRLTNSKFR